MSKKEQTARMDRLFFGINVGLGFFFYKSFCQFIEILLRFNLFAAITQFFPRNAREGEKIFVYPGIFFQKRI